VKLIGALALLLFGVTVAAAQTVTAISLSFAGNGSGNAQAVQLSGSGSLAPFGGATVNIVGGGGKDAFTLAFIFALTDGDTLTTSAGPASTSPDTISGNATVSGGTGVFAGATGSFSYTLTAPAGTTSADVHFSMSGSGNVTTTATNPTACSGNSFTADQDSFVDFNLCGTVPLGATYALLAMRANEECSSCVEGKIDVALSFISFTENGGMNLDPDPDFASGIQSCSLNPQALAELTIEPAANGAGQQLHFSGSAAVQLNCPQSTTQSAFSVTAGAQYNATFRARVSQSSVGVGYFTVIFLSCSSQQTACPVSRDEVPFQSTINGIALTQTGFTVQGVAGGATPPSVELSVLNGETTPYNFTVATSTVSGGSWLSATTSSGVTNATLAPPVITISANPSSLAPGTYYGQVQVNAPGAPNTPQVASVVLNIAAPTANTAPVAQPTGLVFVSPPGTTNPPAQSVTLTELQSTGEPFTITSTFVGSSTSWFTFTPNSGNVQPNQPVNIQVQPNVTGLATGIYTGALNITFSRESITRQIDLLMVIGEPAGPVTGAARTHATSQTSCTPSVLLPVFTLLGSNFTVPSAWPVAISVNVVDDCGNALTSGSVVTNFSNGDAAISLLPSGGGNWSGTWGPTNAVTPALKVTATAATNNLALQGTATIGGTLNANPGVPIVNAGGVVNGGSFAPSASPSPGELVSIFGVNLAAKTDVASGLPLPANLSNVSVVLAGQQMPLLVVSQSQINAIIPFGVAPGSTQIVVSNNNQLSLPQSVQIQPAEPGAFTTNQTGQGQAHIYVISSDGSQTLADVNNPAKPGDAIVIYCSGLGSVSPSGAEAGQATPTNTLYSTVTPAVVTIGGQTANVFFSGLTPGFTGLYQINAYVPTGITAGDSVAVVLSVGGFGGPAVTIAIESGP
jgi:uncharacterized protein (TIGR03437 family)